MTKRGRGKYLKVKAHQEAPGEVCCEEDEHIVINDMADSRAKEAVEWHRMDSGTVQLLGEARSRAKGHLEHLGRRLAAFPRPKDEAITFIHKPGKVLEPRTKYKHRWVWLQGDTYRCADCLRTRRGEQSRVQYMPCAGFRGAMAEVIANRHIHQLSAAQLDGSPKVVVFCRHCGAYSGERGRLLAEPVCRQAKPSSDET